VPINYLHFHGIFRLFIDNQGFIYLSLGLPYRIIFEVNENGEATIFLKVVFKES